MTMANDTLRADFSFFLFKVGEKLNRIIKGTKEEWWEKNYRVHLQSTPFARRIRFNFKSELDRKKSLHRRAAKKHFTHSYTSQTRKAVNIFDEDIILNCNCSADLTSNWQCHVHRTVCCDGLLWGI